MTSFKSLEGNRAAAWSPFVLEADINADIDGTFGTLTREDENVQTT